MSQLLGGVLQQDFRAFRLKRKIKHSQKRRVMSFNPTRDLHLGNINMEFTGVK